MKASSLVTAGLITVGLAWLFGPGMVRDEVYGFRDGGNFYYPTFHWQMTCWARGSVPLWCGQLNGGTDLVAEMSSSTFYPGKLVFALPLSFNRCYNLYLFLHVALAAWSAWRLARQFSVSRAASGLTAVSYAFSGVVLFQYANVIFLVGAAWLPLALLSWEKLLATRSWTWVGGVSASLALMILGGDPQLAYHVLLFCLVRSIAVCLVSPKNAASKTQKGEHSGEPVARATRNNETTNRWCRWRGHPLNLVVATGVLTALLSAVQLLPTLRATAVSDRAAVSTPRNIYDAARLAWNESDRSEQDVKDKIAAGLFGQPKAGTHASRIYSYSVEPWRLVEWLWPNVSGRSFPTHRRWIVKLPSSRSSWSPSLYFGVAPWLLAVYFACSRRKMGIDRWYLAWAIFAVAASFGWYGLGWLAQGVASLVTGRPSDQFTWGSPVGGLYWLLVVLLPRYAYFRYPAKWLVIAALCFSLLAGRSADRLDQTGVRSVMRWLIAFAASSLVVMAALRLTESLWWPTWQAVPADRLFGPFDAAGARRDLYGAFGHGAIVALLAAGLCRWRLSARSDRWRAVAVLLLVVLTTAELLVAHRWLVVTDGGALARRSVVAERLAGPGGDGGSAERQIYRLADEYTPPGWRQTTSPDRLADITSWENDTLAIRHGLRWNTGSFRAPGTLVPAADRAMERVLRRHSEDIPLVAPLPPARILSFLDVAWVLAPRTGPCPPGFQIDAESRHAAGLQLYRVAAGPKRAWIVHRVATVPMPDSNRVDLLERWLDDLFFPSGRLRDLEREAVVAKPLMVTLRKPPADVHESCRVVRERDNEMELEVTTSSPGLVIVADRYAPGWRAAVRPDSATMWRDAELLLVNGRMRGVWLSDGTYRVRMVYRPSDQIAGAAISVLAWACLMLVWLGKSPLRLRRRR